MGVPIQSAPDPSSETAEVTEARSTQATNIINMMNIKAGPSYARSPWSPCITHTYIGLFEYRFNSKEQSQTSLHLQCLPLKHTLVVLKGQCQLQRHNNAQPALVQHCSLPVSMHCSALVKVIECHSDMPARSTSLLSQHCHTSCAVCRELLCTASDINSNVYRARSRCESLQTICT